MRDTDKAGFGKALAKVYDYYDKTLSVGILDIWWQGLNDLTLSEFEQALGRHMRSPDSGQFCPKIADVRKMVSGTTQDSALLAWAKVADAVRRIGPMQSVVFDDALIHAVLESMGGWVKVCNCPSDEDFVFLGKEFENRYRGYARREELPVYQPVMIGMAQAHNEQHGFKVVDPLLIGDPVKAMQVKQSGNQSSQFAITDTREGLMKKIARAA